MSATLTIPEVAEMMGISRNLAYSVASREGEIAGVPVLSVGRRLVVPTVPIRRALGLETDALEDQDEG